MGLNKKREDGTPGCFVNYVPSLDHLPPTAYAVGCILSPLRGWGRLAISTLPNTMCDQSFSARDSTNS